VKIFFGGASRQKTFETASKFFEKRESREYPAAFGGRIKFSEMPVLLILRSKINKTGVS